MFETPYDGSMNRLFHHDNRPLHSGLPPMALNS
jgi:hypothetical protein